MEINEIQANYRYLIINSNNNEYHIVKTERNVSDLLQNNYNIKKKFLKRWKLIINKNNHDNYLNKWDPTKNMKFLSQNQLDDKLSLMFTNIELKED